MKVKVKAIFSKHQDGSDTSSELSGEIPIGEVCNDRGKFELGNIAAGLVDQMIHHEKDLGNFDRVVIDMEVL